MMLASLPLNISSEIKASPQSFRILDGFMGQNSCRYLYGPGDDWLAYSLGGWNGKWMMVHDMTLTPPPEVLLDSAQTVRELIGEDLLANESQPDNRPIT
jgi:hypothetical protein